MKYLFRFILVFLIHSQLSAQSPFDPVMKNYFRENPFEIRFSSFITSLQKDPWFTLDSIYLRTDTSFFFLTGSYKNFNPFRFKTNEVRFNIAEMEFQHSDSLQSLDTMIIIQMIGVADSNLSSAELVSKEFKQFDKKYSAGFWKTDLTGEQSSKDNWMIKNYYHFSLSIPQLSIAWGRMPDTRAFSFVITLRCKLKENQAFPIYFLEGF